MSRYHRRQRPPVGDQAIDSLICWAVVIAWTLCVLNIANQIRHQTDGGDAVVETSTYQEDQNNG